MGFATVNIVYRKDKPNKRGECPIHIRIIKNRKVFYISTGVSLSADFWDDQACKVKKSCPNSVRLNIALQSKLIKYKEEVLKAETTDFQITGNKIKNIIEDSKTASFFTIAKEIGEKYKSKGSYGSYDKVNSIIKKLKDYHGDRDLLFEELNTRFLVKYEAYLISKFKNKANTIAKDFKFIRTVFIHATNQNLISDSINPFKNYKIKTENTSRVFLDSSEVEKFEQFDGTLLANKCRDICLFQYYSGGLRISDVLLLKVKNIQNNYLNIIIHKTHTQLSHILNNRAILILERHIAGKDPEDFVFDFLPKDLNVDNAQNVDKNISSNTALINKGLKLIAKKAEIAKKISTHSFRHSFAINALKKGVRIEEIQKILKHSNIKETLIYARIQNEQIDTALEMFGK
jgi:site-specific recombinase XerD